MWITPASSESTGNYSVIYTKEASNNVLTPSNYKLEQYPKYQQALEQAKYAKLLSASVSMTSNNTQQSLPDILLFIPVFEHQTLDCHQGEECQLRGWLGVYLDLAKCLAPYIEPIQQQHFGFRWQDYQAISTPHPSFETFYNPLDFGLNQF